MYLKNLEIVNKEKYNFENNQERVEKEFYIDQFGKIRKFKGDLYEEYVSIHYEIARQEFPKMKNPDDYIKNHLNWVMVGSSCYHTPIIEDVPSQAQMNTLYRLDLLEFLCIRYGGHYINYIENEAKFY